MLTPEGKIKRDIRNWLKDLPFCEYYSPVDAVTASIEDVLICWCGQYVGLEVKSKKGKSTTLQWLRRKRVTSALGVSAEVRSLEEVVSLFKDLYERRVKGMLAENSAGQRAVEEYIYTPKGARRPKKPKRVSLGRGLGDFQNGDG